MSLAIKEDSVPPAPTPTRPQLSASTPAQAFGLPATLSSSTSLSSRAQSNHPSHMHQILHRRRGSTSSDHAYASTPPTSPKPVGLANALSSPSSTLTSPVIVAIDTSDKLNPGMVTNRPNGKSPRGDNSQQIALGRTENNTEQTISTPRVKSRPVTRNNSLRTEHDPRTPMQDSNTGEMLLHCSNPLKIPQHQQIDIPSDHHPKDRTLDQHGPSPDQTQHPSPRRKPTTPRTNNSSRPVAAAGAIPPPRQRLQSLDILRGVSIVLMIMVNTQGADPFVQLLHTPWFGFTLADWVFPNFVFMVGMGIAIVFSPARILAIQQPATASPPSSSFARTSFWNRYRGRILASLRIIKRATLLFCMGLFINGLELINTSGEDVWIRIPGVLQRIGFSFMILALLLIWSPLRPKSGALEQSHSQISRIGLPLFCTSLWFVLTYGVQSTATIPIPGCDKPPTFPAGDLNSGVALFNQRLTPPQCTAQAYLDALLFTRAHDPNYPMVDAEGTIGTLMSIMTTWLGWVIGVLIMDHQRLQKTMTKRLTEQHDAGQAHDPISAEERSDIASPSSVRALVGPLNESDVSSSSLQEQLTRQQRTNLLASLGQWFMIGVCVMYAGAMLGWFLPISKPLWTPSFTLYTGGVSTTTLCILMYIYDLPSDPMQPRVPEGHVTRGPFYEILNDLWMVLQKMAKVSSQAITSFLICYGCNPTLIYMLSEVVMTVLRRIPVNGGEEWIQSAWAYLFFNSFYRFMSPAWASIFFSLVYILLFAPLMFFLYRRGLFLRV